MNAWKCTLRFCASGRSVVSWKMSISIDLPVPTAPWRNMPRGRGGGGGSGGREWTRRWAARGGGMEAMVGGGWPRVES